MKSGGPLRGALLVAVFVSLAVVQVFAQISANPALLGDEQVKARANALIAMMTPEEKAQQLVTYFVIPLKGMDKNADKQAEAGAGSFLFVTDPNKINDLQRIAMEKSRMKIPILFGFDVIHGFSTVFPAPIGMAATWDCGLVERCQSIAAAEAHAVGVNWTFAPMVDIARDPRWGRIVEGAGEDPFLGSAMATAQVRGFQGKALGTPGHIVAGAKHFVGYGAPDGGRDYEEVNLSDNELWNVYLPPFKAAVDAGVGNLMSAYMPLNGIPCAANRWLLIDVLRRQWGFKGWVASDSEGINSIKTHGYAQDTPGAGANALDAGLDMEMSFGKAAFSEIPLGIKEGKIELSRVDQAVRRILEVKIRLGLFENPYVDVAKAEEALRTPEALTVARVAAERSAVLLRNEGAVLPLDLSKVRSIAVIGSLADSPGDTNGPWVFQDNRPAAQSIIDGIRLKARNKMAVRYAPGVSIPGRAIKWRGDQSGRLKRPTPVSDDAGIAEAVDAARNSDVAIVVVGEPMNMSGESASVSTLKLPGRQQELLDAVVATGKPVVVVLVAGRPIDLQDTKAQAILDMWFPGSRGGDATANLLFGDAVPGGKLPFTWPRNVGQVPMYYSHLTTHEPANAENRYYNDSSKPAWPFGYGLSYSKFYFSNLSIDKQCIKPGEAVTVSVDLENVGAIAADEVAQLYIHQRWGTTAPPVRLLKGFQRVSLNPGEVRRLTFRLGPDELRYWNAATRDWTVDESIIDVAIGGDSTTPFRAFFEIISP